jgi:large subunit ribosomal protein L9
MEVILKEDVNKLGQRGDVVKVADGYGRNFLLPKKLAMEATAANKVVIDQMKQAAVRRSAKEKSEAELLVTQLNNVELLFERKVGENDHLFGSVTAAEIAHQLEQRGFTIDRRKLQLEEPLRQLGEFHVPIKLHREVTAHIKVSDPRGENPQISLFRYAAVEMTILFGNAKYRFQDELSSRPWRSGEIRGFYLVSKALSGRSLSAWLTGREVRRA